MIGSPLRKVMQQLPLGPQFETGGAANRQKGVNNRS
jgi:hypothetical protein